MDIATLSKAGVLGVVEGLTEFLPVSSTGHLILAGSLLQFTGDKVKVFEIAIQTGAILAVILVYWERLRATVQGLPTSAAARRFTANVAIAFVPAAVLGLLFGKLIQAHLFTPWVVATTFIVGGLLILVAERLGIRPRVATVDDMAPMDALKVGLLQCLAMVPGTSRSGATVIGGMLLGLSRKAATDFSFYLAIPTLVAAGGYSVIANRSTLLMADVPMFAIGLLVSFLSAWACVRWLLRYISTHDFVPFAWYRIAFGLVVLLSYWHWGVAWSG